MVLYIILGVAAGLLSCCLCGGGGFYYFVYSVGDGMKKFNDDLEKEIQKQQQMQKQQIQQMDEANKKALQPQKKNK